MLFNAKTGLSTPSVLLVPYTHHHVPLYHKWMQDPALRAATASEPLTLHEEYAMRTSWRADHDKLTFIVCLPLQDGAPGIANAAEDDGEDRMVGDVNLFLFDYAKDDYEDETSKLNDDRGGLGLVGELELMIASPTHQGQGLGRAALVAFMSHLLDSWSAIAAEYQYSDRTVPEQIKSRPPARLEHLRTKIHETNERSISLFRSLGFEVQGAANYFGEVELRWRGGVEDVRRMKGWEEVRVLEYQRIEG